MKKNKPKLSDILQTTDPKTQIERVTEMARAIHAPVVDLIIRHDGRSGQTGMTVIGANLEPASIYWLLDQARDYMRNLELKATQQGKEEEPRENGRHQENPLEPAALESQD